jgi:uncharacterized protein YgiM (DUF1202 family)
MNNTSGSNKRGYRWLGLLTALLMLLMSAACTGKGGSSESASTDSTSKITTVTVTTTTAVPSKGWITASSLNVMGGPGPAPQYKSIGGAGHGDMITIIGREGDWYKIQFTADTVGYVSAQYVQFTPLSDESSATVSK